MRAQDGPYAVPDEFVVGGEDRIGKGPVEKQIWRAARQLRLYGRPVSFDGLGMQSQRLYQSGAFIKDYCRLSVDVEQSSDGVIGLDWASQRLDRDSKTQHICRKRCAVDAINRTAGFFGDSIVLLK
ncbi:hypothetical protein D3C73_1377660 [compost metagenome]